MMWFWGFTLYRRCFPYPGDISCIYWRGHAVDDHFAGAPLLWVGVLKICNL